MPAPVQFNGYRHSIKGHRYPGPDDGYVRPIRDVNEDQGWEIGDVVIFDRALAEQYGRPPDNDGRDWAQLFCEAGSIGYSDDETKPFEIITKADAGLTTPPKPESKPKPDNPPTSGEGS